MCTTNPCRQLNKSPVAELEAKARQQKSAPEAPTGEKAQAAPDVGAISLDVDPVVGAVASPGPDVAPATSVLPPPAVE